MNVLATWNKMSAKPFGKWLFSRAVCMKAPYFATIRPRFEEMRPGFARVSMKKRRRVENHIGTVHAIACCNLAEIAAGTLMEASLPPSMRWIPRTMSVQYLKKAETDLMAVARVDDFSEGAARDVVVAVDVMDAGGQVVVHADIAMYVSPKKKS
jgi:acyl-coenzyme A thioesterase PaaI-like protein